ncbi:MAG: lytic transglycosylase [Betaproteobacteria bacterium]|nr:lytic transglycosylase [Betaproteobacteria bacterium]
MHSKMILPAVLLLTAACAEIPSTPGESFQAPLQGTAQASAQRAAQPLDSAPESEPQIAAPVGPAALPRVASAAPRKAAPHAPSAAHPADTPVDPVTASAADNGPPKNVWTRIRGGFAMAPLDNDLVHEWENWYANRPDYVARMIDRSSRFLYHIVEEVEKRKMPMEVALLPMIESAYNPVAYSRSHASGIWQFIPSTGKDFGLRQNWWYDGRRDIIAATDAALDYLQKLYGLFGDWQLALASYNWGEGAVARAMERNRAKGLPTDYESLTMPAETRGYIPKLVAVKNIISNPARYGLQIADVPNEPYFETVTLKQHIDLKVAAKFADMQLDEFKFLNPGHNKPVIKAGEAERIVLPRHKVLTFLSNFEKHDKPLVSWQAVTFKAGEKAEKVAALHGMTLAELKQLNGLASQRKLVVGQPLLVPLKAGAETPQFPDLPVNPVPLTRAIQAAKLNAHTRRLQPGHGGKIVVQKAAQRGAVRTAKGKRAPAQPLRAERGKQVKVKISAPKPASGRKAPVAGTKQKVASR